MSELTIKLGSQRLRLKKSQSLVGLKTIASRGTEPPPKQLQAATPVYVNLGGFQILSLDTQSEDVNTQLDDLRKSAMVEVGTHVYEVEGSSKVITATGQLLIVFEEGVDEEEQGLTLDEFALALVRRQNATEVIVTVTVDSPNPLKVAKLLEQSSLVRFAEPDVDTVLDTYEDIGKPAEELFGQLWHLQNNGFLPGENYTIKKGADAKVTDAWRRLGNKGSSNITVAIVDNGFDLKHPDLKDNVVKPFDFWTGQTTLPADGRGLTHGTPCAGVALARENGKGVIGVSPNAKFMPLSGTSFDWQTTEEIFSYCIKNGADVISCSWGTTDPQFALNSVKHQAIAKAAIEGRKGLGCVILFAAGNDSLDYLNYYAAHADVISVGASTSRDEHASYSNRGPELTVCAPSNGDWPILTPRASWDGAAWFDGKPRGEAGLYKHFGGTSSATPLVAGICALMLSANPKLTAKEVKEILQQTADKIGNSSDYDQRGHSRKYGHGRVNADRAVAEAIRRRDLNSTQPVVISRTPTGQGLFAFEVERQPSTGYSIQVGVFASYANVLLQVENLKKTFRTKILVNINELNGGTVYKVLVGYFIQRHEATQFQRTMLDRGTDGFVVNLETLK